MNYGPIEGYIVYLLVSLAPSRSTAHQNAPPSEKKMFYSRPFIPHLDTKSNLGPTFTHLYMKDRAIHITCENVYQKRYV